MRPDGATTPESRIPVPSSPAVLRRSLSLRMRGEKPWSWQLGKNSVATPSEKASHTSTPAKDTVADTENSLKGRLSGAGTPVRTRSLSTCSQNGPRTPPTSPDAVAFSRGAGYYTEDDMESVVSFTSVASTAGSCCGSQHAPVARNGTTFSGRSMKYVVHCTQQHVGTSADEYLTPTQRAQRQVRRLKAMLHQAKEDLDQKDCDIIRLTKEVVELRLCKASLGSPEEQSNSSSDPQVTVRENTTDGHTTAEGITPDSPDGRHSHLLKLNDAMHSSFGDSGHFEDSTSSSRGPVETKDQACGTEPDWDSERRTLIETYERRLEDLMRQHGDESQEMRQRHNERVEELLEKLADLSWKYAQVMPDLEQARERIRELEQQLDNVTKDLESQNEKYNKMYLQMYAKIENGPSTSTYDQDTEMQAIPSRVSVTDLLQQLQVTQSELDNIKDWEFATEHPSQARTLLSAKEAVSLWVLGARKAMYRRLAESKAKKSEVDPEATLQFLKSAIYYFLTDRENHQNHLRAIQTILGFSPQEISNIDQARMS